MAPLANELSAAASELGALVRAGIRIDGSREPWSETCWCHRVGSSRPGDGDSRRSATVRPGRRPGGVTGEPGGVFSQMALSSLAGRAVAAVATHLIGATVWPHSRGVAEADPAAATIFVIPAIEE